MSEAQWLDKWECDRCSVIWYAKKKDAHVEYEKMVNGRMRLLCPKCFNRHDNALDGGKEVQGG